MPYLLRIGAFASLMAGSSVSELLERTMSHQKVNLHYLCKDGTVDSCSVILYKIILNDFFFLRAPMRPEVIERFLGPPNNNGISHLLEESVPIRIP